MSKHIPNFYIIHGMFKRNNIFSILRDGKIKSGTDLVAEHSQRYLSMSTSKNPLKYVFSGIYFEDIQNFSYFWQPSIILHPKVLYERGGIFKKSWSGDSVGPNDIIIEKHDKHFIKKINMIHEIVKNYVPDALSPLPFMAHELMLYSNIPLKKYTLMIVSGVCDDKYFNKLKKSSTKCKIPLMRGNSPLPTLNSILPQ